LLAGSGGKGLIEVRKIKDSYLRVHGDELQEVDYKSLEFHVCLHSHQHNKQCKLHVCQPISDLSHLHTTDHKDTHSFETSKKRDGKRKKEDNQKNLRIRVKKYLVGTLAELLGYVDELQEVDYKLFEFHVHLHSHQHKYLDKTWNSPCSHLSHLHTTDHKDIADSFLSRISRRPSKLTNLQTTQS
jgi:hypothetical protein